MAAKSKKSVKKAVSTNSKSTRSSAKPKGVIASSKKRFNFSSTQWAIVGIVTVTVLAIGTYFGVQYYQGTATDAASCVSKVYKQGSSGTCVKYIQQLLNYKIDRNAPNISKISADGVFGAKTASAMKSFQKYWGLTVDGVVGKKTWSSLCSPQMGYTDSKGVSHGVWSSKAALDAARSAGCGVSGAVVR